MVLLQIAEPGTSGIKSNQVAIGIDLGTTNSLVAVVEDAQARIISDSCGNELLPSVVYFPKTAKPLVGQQARSMVSEDVDNSYYSFKRLMGIASSDSTTQLFSNLNIDDRLPRFRTRDGLKTAQEMSAYVLAELKQMALEACGRIDGAVITVPAYFDDSQRQATKDAAKLAGIPLLRLLNEPTAAALAHGIDKKKDGIVAVYDLGGGTFDISILRLAQGVFQVLSTAGDTRLGGDDIDIAVARWMAEQLNTNYSHVMLPEARTIKERLSYTEDYTCEHEGVSLLFTRQELNRRIKPVVDASISLCRQAIKDAEIAETDIEHLVLVGGSTRVPLVSEALSMAFPKIDLYRDLNPDTVVAMGAALQATALVTGSQSSQSRLLLDVIPLSLGIEIMGSMVEHIIPRNTSIPVAVTQEFTTGKDGQNAILIHVVQGERNRVEDCRSLARFTLGSITPDLAGKARVIVTFSLDANGILQVTAREKATGKQAQIEVQPSSGLKESELKIMLDDAWNNTDSDTADMHYRRSVSDAKKLIEATENALNEDKNMLMAEELDFIYTTITKLKTAMDNEDSNTKAIEHLISDLTQATNDFAVQRMENAIQKTLSDKPNISGE